MGKWSVDVIRKRYAPSVAIPSPSVGANVEIACRNTDARPLPRRFYQPHHRPPFVVGQVDLALDVIPQQRKNA